MKRVIAVLAIAFVFVLPAFAQQDTIMKANISFNFIAGGRTMPGGHYEFKVTADRDAITVRNIDTGATAQMVVMTRLAPESFSSSAAHITFDQVGDKAYLEAIWPGVQDGFLLNVTKEKHSHKTVKLG